MAPANLQLRKFDPFRMPPELVRRLAVGREGVLRDMLRVVGENLATIGAPPQHLCLVAPRGTGKTFVLRLLGLELADRTAAGAKLHFLHLPEEMPNVLSPIAFLREIRKRLRGEAPTANAPRKHDDPSAWNGLAADIDDELAKRFGAGAGLLVLCVENIKDVLHDAFPDTAQQRSLRAWLERPAGRIMLIAASSSGPFDKDADKALFAIGHDIALGPWTTAETMEFLDRVMLARDGHKLRPEDERVARAITGFTGGNPRMAVALAEVLGAGDALSAAQTLDGLIDNLQEYYLGRLRDMGKEAKRCVANLLTEGENVSQTEVARRLGVIQSEVAQVFRKLEDDLIIIGDRLPDHKEKLYRVADRVFVHFYNVRVQYHGTERSVLAPILDFLVSAFTESQRVEQAERMIARGLLRDARVLFATLPVINEVTFDFKWWTGLRSFLEWAADVIEARAADAGAAVAELRRIVRDGASAAWIAANDAGAETGLAPAGLDHCPVTPNHPGVMAGLVPAISGSMAGWLEQGDRDARDKRGHDAGEGDSILSTSGLGELVAGLGYLAGGRPHQARHWLSKIGEEGNAPWLVCLSYLAQENTEYLGGTIDAQSNIAQKAENVARKMNDNELLACSIRYTEYVSYVRGDLAQAENAAKQITEFSFPKQLDWWRAAALRRLSDYAGRRGDQQKAMEYARRALEIAESTLQLNGVSGTSKHVVMAGPVPVSSDLSEKPSQGHRDARDKRGHDAGAGNATSSNLGVMAGLVPAISGSMAGGPVQDSRDARGKRGHDAGEGDAASSRDALQAVARAKIRLAQCLIQAKSHEDALALADDAAAICLPEQELDEYLDAVGTSCDALRALGKPRDAIDRARGAVAVMDQQGGPYLRGRACASLAVELSSPAVKADDVPQDEVRAFADRALALLDDSPVFAWYRSLALEAKLAVAGAAKNVTLRLELAKQLVPTARQAARIESLAWAFAEASYARYNLNQYQACIDEAIPALVELLPSSREGVLNHTQFIAAKLVQALRVENRLGEAKAIVADILRRIDAPADGIARAIQARVFLRPALEAGEYAWSVDLADDLLRGRSGNQASEDAGDQTDLMLACIAGAEAWDRMAPHLDDAFWRAAAAQYAGFDVAGVLQQTEAARGRPAAYAVFRGFWNVVRAGPGEATAQFEIMRGVLTSRQMQNLSAGLLIDIADTLAAEAPGRFDAEAQMLREFARFNAAGRDPAMLAHLDPDVATALRLADPTLQAPSQPPPATKRKPAKAGRARKNRRGK